MDFSLMAGPASLERTALFHALQWHLDAGADEALYDTPVDATAIPSLSAAVGGPAPAAAIAPPPPPSSPEGAIAAAAEARKQAAAATTLDELRAAIAGFDGLAVRKTAKSMIFADGLPGAAIMLIGENPTAEEDRSGTPGDGPAGLLLDRVLASIGLDRRADDPLRATYISNVLNWRPPGNRTPTDAEIEIARAFIERHIELAQPKIILIAGGIAAKGLLRTTDSLSKLRGRWHDINGIPALVTHNLPALLSNPLHKRAVWHDLLTLQEKRNDLSLLPPQN